MIPTHEDPLALLAEERRSLTAHLERAWDIWRSDAMAIHPDDPIRSFHVTAQASLPDVYRRLHEIAQTLMAQRQQNGPGLYPHSEAKG